MCVCFCARARARVCICVCVCACAQVHVCVRVHACVHMCVQAFPFQDQSFLQKGNLFFHIDFFNNGSKISMVFGSHC